MRPSRAHKLKSTPLLFPSLFLTQERQYGADADGPEGMQTEDEYPGGTGSFSGGYSERELLERVQSSAGELQAALHDRHALCLGGLMRHSWSVWRGFRCWWGWHSCSFWCVGGAAVACGGCGTPVAHVSGDSQCGQSSVSVVQWDLEVSTATPCHVLPYHAPWMHASHRARCCIWCTLQPPPTPSHLSFPYRWPLVHVGCLL